MPVLPPGAARPEEAPPGAADITRRYGAAMVTGNGEEAQGIALGALADGMPVAALYEEVMAPAMAHVGELWARGEMTIADEHLASALNLKVMASVYAVSLPARPRRSAGRVLLAGVEGDRHGVGLRMAGDVIDLAGFELVYLGADIPTPELLRSLAAVRPDVLALGVPSPAAGAVAGRIVAAIRRSCGDMSIVIGGQGVPDATAPDGVMHGVSLRDLVGQVARGVPVDRAPEPSPSVAVDLPIRRPTPRPEASPEDRMLDIAAESAEATRASARAGEAYRRLAHEDPLTGVANRRAFEERVAGAIEAGRPATVLMVDLDRFKQVNDHLGHLAGDRVLIAVAGLLEASAGPGDFVARIGGDEFALLLEADSVEAGRRHGERLLDAFRDDSVASQLTATCGVSRLDGDRRQALIAADLALYRGKAAGGDRVEAD